MPSAVVCKIPVYKGAYPGIGTCSTLGASLCPNWAFQYTHVAVLVFAILASKHRVCTYAMCVYSQKHPISFQCLLLAPKRKRNDLQSVVEELSLPVQKCSGPTPKTQLVHFGKTFIVCTVPVCLWPVHVVIEQKFLVVVFLWEECDHVRFQLILGVHRMEPDRTTDGHGLNE